MMNVSVKPHDIKQLLRDLREDIANMADSADELSEQDWEALTLRVFRFQATHNAVYKEFVALLGVVPGTVQSVADIPFMPVEVFQTHEVHVLAESEKPDAIFCSSGTTGSVPSRHVVDDLAWYNRIAQRGFERLMGPFENAVFIALLPGYLERGDSSLVHMVRSFMTHTHQPDVDEWFFLRDWKGLETKLDNLATSGSKQQVYLIGVTHALLSWEQSLSDQRILDWSHQNLQIIETGGMKGEAVELVREEVHARLSRLVQTEVVCSEYGMTELLSQAWSKGRGIFKTPPWMRVMVGAIDDPGQWLPNGQQGRIHVIDLANVASCAFLSTGDVGRRFADGSFEINGRYDQAEVRGCNLMASDF
jgi:hypothetical protein